MVSVSAGKWAKKGSSHSLLWKSKAALQVGGWEWKQLFRILCQTVVRRYRETPNKLSRHWNNCSLQGEQRQQTWQHASKKMRYLENIGRFYLDPLTLSVALYTYICIQRKHAFECWGNFIFYLWITKQISKMLSDF